MDALYAAVDVFDRGAAAAAGALFDHLDEAPIGKLTEAARYLGQLSADLLDELGGAHGTHAQLGKDADSPRVGEGPRHPGADPEGGRFLSFDRTPHFSPLSRS